LFVLPFYIYPVSACVLLLVSPCRWLSGTAPEAAFCLNGQNHDLMGARGGFRRVGGAGKVTLFTTK